ncbi:MAG: LysM peptidoglycan-binding domain-containing protein [Anaerolineales bacterium]|nr:LysM peptidoglycan-binding domain-containing protein [Anaerolineales bacterium]
MPKSLFLLFFLITACATPNNQPADISLQPYLTNTPQITNTPNILFIETTAIPTSTPQIYIIEAGDTFSEIAEKFNIPISDLRAANPDVNPNTLTIGDSILIPDPSSIFASASTPTPLPVPITQTVCYADSSAGTHCFALIQNNTNLILENVSVKFNLLDETNSIIASKTVFTILDIIPANSSLPVYAYFPNVSQKVNPQVQLLSAFQNSSNNYLPAVINNSIAEIDGKFAQLSGKIYLPTESQPATQIWVVAVAYDKNKIVVGVKRWEGGGIQPGGSINFEFSVASVSQEIEAVEFFIQSK